MTSPFESGLSFGQAGATAEAQSASGSMFDLRRMRHPTIVLAHLAFRAAALFFYVFAYFFTDSFIIQFLVILLLLSMDFWAVKNVTGRLLVGLRWWNFVDEEGSNHWKFESAKDATRFDAIERKVFWLGLVAAPVFWMALTAVAFVTFKWEWMVVAILGLAMTSANLYGYLRCRWASTNQFTNYVSRWAFLSMLSSANRNPANDQQNLPQEVV